MTENIWKIVETLLIAGIIGGITMWGTSQRVDEKLIGISATLVEMKIDLKTTADTLTSHLINSGARDTARDIRDET